MIRVTTHGASPSKSARANMAKVVFSGAVVALALAGTYSSAPNSFAFDDLLGISTLAFLVNLILLLAAVSIFRSRLIANALAAGTVLAGAMTMYVVHTPLYRSGEVILVAALAIVAYATLLVALKATDDRPWVGALLATVITVGIGVVLLRTVMQPSIEPSGYKDASFAVKPNVYLVGFDGLTPTALLDRFGTDTTPFHSLIEDRFRTFRNFFSNDQATWGFYNKVLSLDDSDEVTQYHFNYFSGTKDAPLFRLFRSNGYEITTMYRNQYFGTDKGPYIDNYVVTNNESACALLDDSIVQISFYGYCAIRPLLSPVWPPVNSQGARRRIVESVLQRSGMRQPQLVLAHISIPNHTAYPFDMEDETQMAYFRESYLTASEEAAVHLASIVEHLEVNDPSAILFVFGDHGPWLSWSVRVVENLHLVVTDRQATVGAIFPPQRCSLYMDLPAERTANYMTVLDVVFGIIRCLAGGAGHSSTFERSHWRSLYDGYGVHEGFGDFLYE